MKCLRYHFNNPDDTIYCGQCAIPLPSSEEISAPTKTIEAAKEELTIGSSFAGCNQIIEDLDRERMRKVYRVTDTRIKEKVSPKLIKPEISSDKKKLGRFGNKLRV